LILAVPFLKPAADAPLELSDNLKAFKNESLELSDNLQSLRSVAAAGSSAGWYSSFAPLAVACRYPR